MYRALLSACVALGGLASYIVLALGASGVKRTSPLAEMIIARFMGFSSPPWPFNFSLKVSRAPVACLCDNHHLLW